MLCLPSTWSTALNDIWRVRLDWDKREAVRSLMFGHTQNIPLFLCTQHVCTGEWCGHGGVEAAFPLGEEADRWETWFSAPEQILQWQPTWICHYSTENTGENLQSLSHGYLENSYSPLPNSINAQCIISPCFTAWCNGMNVESDWLLFLTCLLC